MKILLTGGLGFIGKNFILHRPKEWEITSFDINLDNKFQKLAKNTKLFQIDLRDSDQVKKISQKLNKKYDIFLHLAANGNPAISITDPAWDLEATTISLINTCKYFKIKKIIYLSSGAVYDGHRGIISPKKEIKPILPYSISHFSAERYVQYFQKSGQIEKYLILRFFGAYGPYEPDRKIYTKLVRAFGIQNQNEFIIRGDGLNRIDAMTVEDAISGIVKAIKSPRVNITVDFCKGDHLTINDLVKKAAKIFGQDIKIKHQGRVPEYNQFYASPREFEKLFGFRPKIELEEGMRKLKEHIIKFEARRTKSETNSNIKKKKSFKH